MISARTQNLKTFPRHFVYSFLPVTIILGSLRFYVALVYRAWLLQILYKCYDFEELFVNPFCYQFPLLFKTFPVFSKIIQAEEYLEPSRTSTMKDFAKMVNGYPEVFCKKSVLINFAKFTG